MKIINIYNKTKKYYNKQEKLNKIKKKHKQDQNKQTKEKINCQKLFKVSEWYLIITNPKICLLDLKSINTILDNLTSLLKVSP